MTMIRRLFLILAGCTVFTAIAEDRVGDARRTWQGIPGLERTAKGRVFVSWFTSGPKEPRDRQGEGEIPLAKFREEDVAAGKDVSGAVTLKQVINKLDKPKLLPAGWDSALAGDEVMERLVNSSAPRVSGAHDAEFVCVGDRAY